LNYSPLFLVTFPLPHNVVSKWPSIFSIYLLAAISQV